jgi:hypothetical protein
MEEEGNQLKYYHMVVFGDSPNRCGYRRDLSILFQIEESPCVWGSFQFWGPTNTPYVDLL